ncbi:hypothetical protein D3105_11630 [Streptomyces globisporus]|uniref:Uncharacterized protein n=1 Tax=Streptomyces globisporus TaxID=1908 RepID=A0A423V155_STRGL|nr:hypothetical protein D3105_11630 [Streptomyces globisporus]
MRHPSGLPSSAGFAFTAPSQCSEADQRRPAPRSKQRSSAPVAVLSAARPSALSSPPAQGAVAHDGTLYVNESKGTDEPSNLWRYQWVGLCRRSANCSR